MSADNNQKKINVKTKKIRETELPDTRQESTFEDLILEGKSSKIIINDSEYSLIKTGYHLMERGYDVSVLNLKDTSYSNFYNPLLYLSEDIDVADFAGFFSKILSKDYEILDNYEDVARALLEALILYVVNNEELSDKDRTITNVLQLTKASWFDETDTDQTSRLDALFKRDETNGLNIVATRQYRLFKTNTPRARLIAASRLAEKLRVYNFDAIKDLTSTDEMNLNDFCDRNIKKAIYIITGSKSLEHLIDTLMYQVDNIVSRSKNKISIELLDGIEYKKESIITNPVITNIGHESFRKNPGDFSLKKFKKEKTEKDDVIEDLLNNAKKSPKKKFKTVYLYPPEEDANEDDSLTKDVFLEEFNYNVNIDPSQSKASTKKKKLTEASARERNNLRAQLTKEQKKKESKSAINLLDASDPFKDVPVSKNLDEDKDESEESSLENNLIKKQKKDI